MEIKAGSRLGCKILFIFLFILVMVLANIKTISLSTGLNSSLKGLP